MAHAEATQVSVCNLALSWLGANTITSLDDDVKEANLCKAIFDLSRDVVLESRPWSFALSRDILSTPVDFSNEFNAPSRLNPDDQPWGYDYAFQIPVGSLRILGAWDPEQGSARTGRYMYNREPSYLDWAKIGTYLLCNIKSVYIEYVVRVVTPADWSSAFIHALAARMAMDLAIPITRSRAMQKQMAMLFDAKLSEAAALDGMQGRHQSIKSSYFKRIR